MLLLSWFSAVWLLLAGTPGPPLVLQPARLPFVPREYYVAAVTDARPTPGPVARLLPMATAPQPELVDLQGGTLPALQAFVRRSVPAVPTLRPVALHLLALRIDETPGPGGTLDGRITVALALDWTRAGVVVPLTQYRGGARYRRLPGQRAAVEPALRQALVGALQHFDGWMNQQAPHNVALARRLRVRFVADTRREAADTLFYHFDRPLQWSDFTGARRPGSFAAAVFPSLAYQGRPHVENGELWLDLTLQVFVVRSSSWTTTQDARSLRHEQGHFDLVKLVGERFRRNARPDSLTVEDYNSQLQLQYLRAYWAMNRVQEQYEAETRHGLDEAAQQRWNQQIATDLQAARTAAPAD